MTFLPNHLAPPSRLSRGQNPHFTDKEKQGQGKATQDHSCNVEPRTPGVPHTKVRSMPQEAS